MIKKEAIVNEVEIDNDFNPIAYKGKVVKVIEVSELERSFMSHRFKSTTLKTMFWAQFNINYCGG
jgi:hypothetical protein